MIRTRTAALVVAGAIVTVTATLGAASPAPSAGPVEQVIQIARDTVNGAPHCC
jgi:type IV secretory pathway VirB2 component (pilin)